MIVAVVVGSLILGGLFGAAAVLLYIAKGFQW